MIDNHEFMNKLPKLSHHVPEGKFRNDIDNGYSFKCGCGEIHMARNAWAVQEHKEAGNAIYACPKDDYLLNLVEPIGFFRVKGIETVVSYSSSPSDPIYTSIFVYRAMKEKGIESLSDYYSDC